MNNVFRFSVYGLLTSHTAHRTSNRHCTAGFTLLELIVVMVLIGLILFMAGFVSINAIPSARLESTARDVSTTIKQAKALAQINGTDQTLTFNLDERLYGIEGTTPRKFPPDISVRIDDPASGQVQRGLYSMTFRVAGGVEGGTIVLWHKQKTFYIEADPVVGSVMVKK